MDIVDTDRARAMWYWRLAKRFGDEAAEKRYRERLRAFRRLLTPEERKTYGRAVKYWREVYR